jgi:cytochrome b6-f complex iron-sulfur subunit
MKIEESCIARRRFLCSMIGGGAGALALGAAVPVAYYAGNLREEPPPPFLKLPKTEYDLPPGKAKLIRYGRIPVLMIHTPEPQSDLRLFVANCTHLDCTVGYQETENLIFCACHKGYYDLNGHVISGPPPAPLRKLYSKELPDGTLVIALEKENLEKALEEPHA